MVNSNENRNDIVNQIKKSEKSAWFRFFLSLGFASIAIGLGIAFSSTESLVNPMKSVLAGAVLVLGIVIMFRVALKYYPEEFHKRFAEIGIVVLVVGVIGMMVEAILKTEYNITVPHLLPYSILIGLVGFILTVVSLIKFRK